MPNEILSLVTWLFSRLIIKLILIVLLAAGFTRYYKYLQARRELKPRYVKGIITDRFVRKQKAYFQYKFRINDKAYINSAYRSLCSECKDISCVAGDSILIEYRKDNPANRTPVCNP